MSLISIFVYLILWHSVFKRIYLFIEMSALGVKSVYGSISIDDSKQENRIA